MQGPVFLQSFWELCKICEILTNNLLFSGLNCPCAVKQRHFHTNFESFRTSFKVISHFWAFAYLLMVLNPLSNFGNIGQMWNSSPFCSKKIGLLFYFDFANDKIFLKNLPVSTTKRPSRGRNRVLMIVKSMTSWRISLRNKNFSLSLSIVWACYCFEQRRRNAHLFIMSTQTIYVNQKLHSLSRFATLRAISNLFSFFYTPCRLYRFVQCHKSWWFLVFLIFFLLGLCLLLFGKTYCLVLCFAWMPLTYDLPVAASYFRTSTE